MIRKRYEAYCVDREEIRRKLPVLREAVGTSQAKVAKQIGAKSGSLIGQFERGEIGLPVERLEKLEALIDSWWDRIIAVHEGRAIDPNISDAIERGIIDPENFEVVPGELVAV